MIPIAAESFFIILATLAVLAGGLLWILLSLRAGKLHQPFSTERLCRCRSCALIFVVPRRSEDKVPCPRCRSPDQAVGKGRI
jgi:uncharacterized paraquat-inducible protein A